MVSHRVAYYDHYINDLSHAVQTFIKLFADDTKLYAHINHTNPSIL